MAGIEAGSDTRIADSILETVAQEQAYQELNDRLKQLEAEVKREGEEKAKLQAERDELATTNDQLQEANNSTQSTFATISSNVRDYETRIRILEREKDEIQQDLLQLKQKSRTDDDLVRKYRESSESDGRQIRQLDVERSEAIYARNKIEHQQKILTSALDTARQEAALYSKALVDKEAEFASYRSSHYTELQQTLSDRDRESQAKSQAEISRDQLSRQYQQNLDALNAAQSEIAQLQNKLQKKTSDFRSDATALQNRIDQLEARSREDREAVEGLEEAFRESQEAHRKRIEEYEDEIEEWREAQEETKKELAEMARNVELLTQADKMGSSGIIGIDTAADLAAHFGGPESTIASNRASKQILTEVVRLQAESGKLKAENTRLESLCRSVLRDLEEKQPVFEQKETERHELKEKVEQLGKNLAVTIQAKESLAVELSDVKASFSNAQKDNQSQRTQLADLGLQVRVLTREVAIRDDPALAYEAFDPVDANHPEISDIDAVITNNLTAFKKLPHLLEQNKKLLRISRELGRKLEEKTSSHGADANDSDLESAAQAIESLTGTVVALRGQIANAKLQLDMAVKERDMFSRLLVQGRMMGLSSEIVDRIANGIETSDPVQAQDDVVRSALKGIQQEFDKHRESFQSEIKQLQARTEEKTREVDVERERTASALASLRHEQNQNLALTQRMEQEKSDLNTHLHTITIREAEILNLRTEMRRLREEEDALTQQKSQLQSLLDGSNAQKEMLLANEQISVESANKLFQEKAELSRELASRRLLHEQELLVAQNAKREIEIAITSLREDLETARNNLADQRTAYQTLLTSQKSPEMKNRIEELESSLIAVKAERDEQVAKLESDVKAAQTDAQGKLNIGLKYQRRTKELLAQIADTKDQHTKAIADLQSQIDTLKAQSQTLENDVTAARQEAALKAKEVEDNSQEMAVTKRSLEEREAEIAKMGQAVPSETAQSGSAISEDAAKAMQSSLDLAKERISELEKELSAVRVAHDEAVNASQKPTATQTQAETVRAVNSDMEKDLENLKAQHALALSSITNRAIDAEEEAKRLSIRIEVLEQEISHARAQLHAQTQTAAQTAPVSDEANVVDNKADTGGAETATPKIHVDNLQAEFDEYKTAQTKRYEEGVLKVNTTNKKLQQENKQWREAKTHIEKLQQEYNISSKDGPSDLTVSIDEIIAVLRSERDKALASAQAATAEKARLEEELKAAVETAKANPTAGQPASDENAATTKALTEERDEARKQVESLTTQLRAAEEKAAKAAVKASMTDKYKKDLAELRQKVAAQSIPNAAAPVPSTGLSIKGESGGTVVSTDDAIDIKPAGTSIAGAAASGRGARGGRGTAVRGGNAPRGAARGAARGRGRGGIANGTGLTAQSILATVEQGFASNAGQKRRASENHGNATQSQDGTKRPKLDGPEQGSGGLPPS